MHSTTNKRPLDIFFGRSVTTDPEKYENCRRENKELLKQKQSMDIQTHNKRRIDIRTYTTAQEIYVKFNTRLGIKL